MNKYNPYTNDDEEISLPRLRELVNEELKKQEKVVVKKKKLRLRIQYVVISFIIFLTLSLVSVYNIFKWKSDNDNTKNIMIEVSEDVEVIEIKDSEETEIINPPQVEKKENLYWDYIKMNLIDVNFDELKTINSDTVGWLRVEGTNINYPFVQTSDNNYYLKRDFKKKYSNAGWVFMDYRNKLSNLDRNTIIYAHGRVDGTMFGSLKNIFSSNWYQNKNNYIVKMSTEYNNSMWQVFSVYIIPETSDYLKIDFKDDYEYIEFLYMLQGRSEYEFDVELNKEDKILTLSTCYKENERVVLHAKLIKMEVK